jgi:hypothetical protein
MDKRSDPRRDDREVDRPERRASGRARGLSRALHLLKNLWARPLGMERRGRGLRVVLVERRRPPSPDEPPKMAQIRSEMRERLLGHKHAHAAQVMRHLALVHDELGRTGWPGVEGLTAQVLGMATVQAEMLASEAPSVVMSHLIGRLHIFKVAADVREERRLREERAALARSTLPGMSTETSEPAEARIEEDTGTWDGPVPVPVVIPEPKA